MSKKTITLKQIEWIAEDIIDDDDWVNDTHTEAEQK